LSRSPNHPILVPRYHDRSFRSIGWQN
jgi:hypothetical protein